MALTWSGYNAGIPGKRGNGLGDSGGFCRHQGLPARKYQTADLNVRGRRNPRPKRRRCRAGSMDVRRISCA